MRLKGKRRKTALINSSIELRKGAAIRRRRT